MNNMKSNIINIEKDTSTFLKGLAILLVVLSHMGYVYRGGTWGVNIFLILSGYGVFQSYLNKGTVGYFRNKIKKVYFPYLMVTIFVLIYSAMKQKLEIKMIVFSLLGLDFGNLCDKTMWFVSYIFAQYVIFYLSTLLFGRIKNSHKKHFLMILFCFIVSIALLITDYYCGIWGRGAGIFLYNFTAI